MLNATFQFGGIETLIYECAVGHAPPREIQQTATMEVQAGWNPTQRLPGPAGGDKMDQKYSIKTSNDVGGNRKRKSAQRNVLEPRTTEDVDSEAVGAFE